MSDGSVRISGSLVDGATSVPADIAIADGRLVVVPQGLTARLAGREPLLVLDLGDIAWMRALGLWDVLRHGWLPMMIAIEIGTAAGGLYWLHVTSGGMGFLNQCHLRGVSTMRPRDWQGRGTRPWNARLLNPLRELAFLVAVALLALGVFLGWSLIAMAVLVVVFTGLRAFEMLVTQPRRLRQRIRDHTGNRV